MNLEKLFEDSPCPTEHKLANFPKYVRRQEIARFLCRYEIFKRQLNVKGSVVECGVHHGGGVMTWAQFSATLEPYNYHRKIVGFDTFQGFPAVVEQDGHGVNAHVGAFGEGYDIHAELTRSVGQFDENRFINHKQKVELVRGDANKTIPQYVSENPHLVVSLLYLDFDIYEPTVTALRELLPRIPKGGIVAFDEVNNEEWPGETLAMIEQLQLRNQRLECLPFEPNISFIQLD
jgi:macrocin-O-methyltransferase TylF-like protien